MTNTSSEITMSRVSAESIFGAIGEHLGDAKGEVPVFSIPEDNKLSENVPAQIDYFYNRNNLRDLLAWNELTQGEGLFFSGPPGSGKSTLVSAVCAKLCIPLFSFVGHQNLEWESLVGGIGFYNGRTVFQPGPLTMALKDGAWFLLDEVDLIPAGVLTALNQVLDGRGLTTPAGTYVRPHKNFRLLVTANTWGDGTSAQFVGTQKLNTAFLDRFMRVYVDYPDEDHEVAILENAFKGTVDKKIIQGMVKLAVLIRDAFKSSQCNVTLSTRALVRWAEYSMALERSLVAEGTSQDALAYTFRKFVLAGANKASKIAILSFYNQTIGSFPED